jgi:hypothetical protein
LQKYTPMPESLIYFFILKKGGILEIFQDLTENPNKRGKLKIFLKKKK